MLQQVLCRTGKKGLIVRAGKPAPNYIQLTLVTQLAVLLHC